jgi:hypothetical protein
VAAGHAAEDEHTVGGQRVERVERDARDADGLEDDVENTRALGELLEWNVLRGYVSAPKERASFARSLSPGSRE